jgi:Lon protease-like protein
MVNWPTEPMPDRLMVPLFPLPNVVLFPGAILPLHIFEPRYKRMTAEVLDGDKLLAMALLRAGWEKSYYDRPAIELVVCIGRIVAHERLPDGKYNFLLQGQWRASVQNESSSGGESPYRMATVATVGKKAMEIDLAAHRIKLVEIFSSSPLATTGLGRQFARLLGSSMPTEQVADLLAYNYLEDVAMKQSLLSEANADRRVARIVSMMDEVQHQPAQTEKPESSCDASLN